VYDESWRDHLLLKVVYEFKVPAACSCFKLNVSAESQKRTIHVFHELEGRDESRFALKSKKKHRLELQVTIVKYILSLLGRNGLCLI
jgi:hypothetical protein